MVKLRFAEPQKTKPNIIKAKVIGQKAKGIENFMLLCSCALLLFLQNKANFEQKIATAFGLAMTPIYTFCAFLWR
jgi:Ca2+/Na+ antiporter